MRNQSRAHENLKWTVIVHFTSARVLVNADFGFTAVYVIFRYFTFLGMRIGPNWYGFSAGQV